MNDKQKKIIYDLIICICVIAFISSAINLFYNKYINVKEDELIEEIRSKKNNSQDENSEEDKELNNNQNEILAEYKKLYEENNDLYGWIEIEDTPIDYPVMFTPEDSNYYIRKNWNKKYSPYGNIYISGETKKDSENIIVYGHDTQNNRMFGSLKLYKDKKYYEEHKYIQFDTLYKKQTYEIISVSKAKVYYDENKIPEGEYLFYNHIELDTEEEFNDYINYVKENALYDIDITAKFGDQLITLCTCDYWTKDVRLLIIAKKI